MFSSFFDFEEIFSPLPFFVFQNVGLFGLACVIFEQKQKKLYSPQRTQRAQRANLRTFYFTNRNKFNNVLPYDTKNLNPEAYEKYEDND